MIGFQPELLGDLPQPDESLETRNLEKKELYDMVTAIWCLPPYTSKGVTREYLLQVHSAQVFRVNTNELRRFEVELTKDSLKKVGAINNALLVKKLNILLAEQGNRTLGFTEFEIPESNWLFRVARYIDQTNLLEIFERPVRPEPPLSNHSKTCSRIYYGRMFASTHLFRSARVRENKKLWENFKSISDTYRTLTSYKINLEVLNHELEETQRKVLQYQVSLDDQVTKAAFTYTALDNPNIRPETILGGPETFTPEMREAVNGNMRCKLLFITVISFIYCSDQALSREDAATLDLVNQSLARMAEARGIPAHSPSKQLSSTQQKTQQRENRQRTTMEAENNH